MTDIVERLRAACSIPDMGVSGLIGEAADEIERLRKALAQMVEISQRNSDPALMLLAIRKCAEHARTDDRHR